jgi:quercetin dioxygenase-like cupin family protein
MNDRDDDVEFDDTIAKALALTVPGAEPGRAVKDRLMARVRSSKEVPPGFSFTYERPGADEHEWLAHPVPGIRMKILALNKARGYATLLLDVAPGTRFPRHHHSGAEECFVVAGSLYTCDRRLCAGDFVHADGDTDHGELWTDEGCRVILIVPPEDHLPEYLLQ